MVPWIELPLLNSTTVAIIDLTDAGLLAYKWSLYESTTGGLYVKRTTGRNVRLHRELLKEQLTPGMTVDHINGDSLDNRRSNLRVATAKQNCANRGRRKDNKTGYIGVHKIPSGFRAVAGKCHVGVFATAEEAARARDSVAKALYGEFAKLNFE